MTETCARCGQEAKGFATIGDDRYCHDDSQKPSCYIFASWERASVSLMSEWGKTLKILGES